MPLTRREIELKLQRLLSRLDALEAGQEALAACCAQVLETVGLIYDEVQGTAPNRALSAGASRADLSIGTVTDEALFAYAVRLLAGASTADIVFAAPNIPPILAARVEATLPAGASTASLALSTATLDGSLAAAQSLAAGASTAALSVSETTTPSLLSVERTLTSNTSTADLALTTTTDQNLLTVTSGATTYYREIDVKSSLFSSGTLSNFPMLMEVTLGLNAPSTADNIVWRNSSGTTDYPKETLFYNSNTGAWRGYVRVPSLSASANTTLRVYYGGVTDTGTDSDVWSNGFSRVWHPGLTDLTSNKLYDSARGVDDSITVVGGTEAFTISNTATGSYIQQGAQKTEKCGLEISTLTDTDLAASDWTVEVYSDSNTEYNPLISRWNDGNSSWDWLFYRSNNVGEYYFGPETGGTTVTSDSDFSGIGSALCVGRFHSGDEILFWIDGAIAGIRTNVSAASPNASGSVITLLGSGDGFFIVNSYQVSEIRISNSTLRSSAWIEASYNSVTDTQNQLGSLGAEQTA